MQRRLLGEGLKLSGALPAGRAGCPCRARALAMLCRLHPPPRLQVTPCQSNGPLAGWLVCTVQPVRL